MMVILKLLPYEAVAQWTSNMRNKLAHEVTDLDFRDSDLIELLSPEQISQEPFELLQNFDLLKMDEMTQYIASNVIYIRKIISKLTIS